MRRPLIALILGVVLPTVILFSVTRKVRAAGPTFTTIDFPGAPRTIATGINFAGTIVGDFCFICKSFEDLHGYVLTQGTFTEIDFPDAAWTRPLGINDVGNIVGVFRDSKNGMDHGFLLNGGTFTSIDFPGADQTTALGIDRDGRIVGAYCIGGNSCYAAGQNVHGYLLAGGLFTTIDFPGAVFSELAGITGGQIIGRYAAADGIFHLFLLTNGTFTSIDFPGAAETAPFVAAPSGAGGINAAGEIVSSYCSATPCTLASGTVHGFILSRGTSTSFDFPGALTTGGFGINSFGDIVGGYITPNGGIHGYLRSP